MRENQYPYPDLMKQIDITLEDVDGLKLHLPVNPSEIQIRRERSYETIQMIDANEIDFPRGEKVKEISFSSFFPAEYDPSYCRYDSIPNPQLAMNQLNTWMNNRTPLRLIVTRTEVNVLVMIASHNSTFRANEPGDVYYDLTLRTWREAAIHQLASGQQDAAGEPRPDLKPVPATYTVKPGDSLWGIAKQNLGTGGRWNELYTRNKDVIGPDPERIYPGQELVMPE